MTNICSSCGKGCVSPKLSTKPYLIIKEQITQQELDAGSVFVQKGKNQWGYEQNTTSYYLNREMGLVGLQLHTFNLTNLYNHILPKNKKTKEDKEIIQGCIEFSRQQVLKLAEGKKIILLLGSGTVKAFSDYSASEIYGLPFQSEQLPNVPCLIAGINTDKLMSQPIGELRITLKSLSEQVKIYEAYSRI